MLNNKSKRRFVVGMVGISCVTGVLYLLWRNEMLNAWTIILGAAYFYADRVHKEEEKKKHE
jgi:hypothetical protein